MRRVIFLFLFLLSLSFSALGQDVTSIDLRGLAAFRPGDDDVWRSKYIDEELEWSFLAVPGAWEEHGFPLLDGFAWYRVRFRIPVSMRNDSLLLVMSGVDDADETFLNGVMVGKTGGFPPAVRSELRSLRVYPLPRFIREEHNLLAVRVFDAGDQGGITGSIFRIVRADSMHRVLDEIVDAPRKRPPLFISNGVMVSAWASDSATLLWSRPHLYDRITPDLPTETVLSGLSLDFDDGSGPMPFRPRRAGYIEGSGIVTAEADGIEIFLYHPLRSSVRLLVLAVRQRDDDRRTAILRFVMDRPYWRYEERTQEQDDGTRFTYHLLAYHSCCTELVDRDMEEFLERGAEAWSLTTQLEAWRDEVARTRYLPDVLSADEQTVYRRALVTMRQMQVREAGAGEGQFVAALQPPSKAACDPAAMLLAAEAFCAAGWREPAVAALDFVRRAEHDRYKLFDVYGEEFGVGFPYLVTPSRYDGSGGEWQWTRADAAVLRYEAMPRYIIAVDALRESLRQDVIARGEDFSDSAFVAGEWPRLSANVADVLMYRLDSLGLLAQDDGPWGAPLSRLPGVYSTVLASHALRIAARHATLIGQDLKAFLYEEAADRAADAVQGLIDGVLAADRADSLSALEMRLFHPLITDAVTYAVVEASSPAGRFVFDAVESGFAIEDTSGLYRAEPGGDWMARQSRPQLALRLARAYAAAGDLPRAERLFATVTREALRHDGLLSELVDPVTGNCHGALPSLGTSADYVLTAEAIARARLARR
ncbi:MAG: hypothetical protein KFF77_09055 [Bacteroidetes bacterium]|nr:hypothetical protein [Bacteroidota bacterium]